MARWARDKGMTKVFKITLTSRLPSAQLLFSIIANKVQIINFIVEDLVQHKDDDVVNNLILTGQESVPYQLPGGGVLTRCDDTETTKEEADTIILQQVNVDFWKSYDIG